MLANGMLDACIRAFDIWLGVLVLVPSSIGDFLGETVLRFLYHSRVFHWVEC